MQEFKREKTKNITELALYNIVEDLSSFLLKEVIPREGKYHDHDSELFKPEYRALTVSSLKFTQKGY